MGTVSDDRVMRVVRQVETTIGRDPSTWPAWGGGYPGQIELALIDAVFSANARYGKTPERGVRRVVSNWRDADANAGRRLDDLGELLERAGDPQHFSATLDSLQKVPGGRVDRPLKSEAVLRTATALVDGGVRNAADVVSGRVPEETLRRLFVRTRGVGEVTFTYFLMLLGVPGVKADRMVRRFVAKALGVADVRAEDARSLLAAAAVELDTDATTLDHAVWRYQSRGG